MEAGIVKDGIHSLHISTHVQARNTATQVWKKTIVEILMEKDTFGAIQQIQKSDGNSALQLVKINQNHTARILNI